MLLTGREGNADAEIQDAASRTEFLEAFSGAFLRAVSWAFLGAVFRRSFGAAFRNSTEIYQYGGYTYLFRP